MAGVGRCGSGWVAWVTARPRERRGGRQAAPSPCPAQGSLERSNSGVCSSDDSAERLGGKGEQQNLPHGPSGLSAEEQKAAACAKMISVV